MQLWFLFFFSIFSKIGSYINNYPLKSKKLWTNVFLPCLLLVGELLVGPSEWAWFSSSVVQQQSWVLPISPFSMWHIDARIWLETEKVAACFCSMAWSIFFLFGPENHSSNSRKVVRLSGSCKGVIVVLKGKTVSSKTTSQETKTLLVYGCKHLYPLCNELYLMKTQGKVFLEIFFFHGAWNKGNTYNQVLSCNQDAFQITCDMEFPYSRLMMAIRCTVVRNTSTHNLTQTSLWTQFQLCIDIFSLLNHFVLEYVNKKAVENTTFCKMIHKKLRKWTHPQGHFENFLFFYQNDFLLRRWNFTKQSQKSDLCFNG